MKNSFLNQVTKVFRPSKRTIARQPWRQLSACVISSMISAPSFSAAELFDDFNYQSANDPKITQHGWTIIDGPSGPPAGANYGKDHISFYQYDDNGRNNSVMTVTTSVAGTFESLTNARIETQPIFREGIFAARVYFDSSPALYRDGNVETFYTIRWQPDTDTYTELDFEYLPFDMWGSRDERMYITAWARAGSTSDHAHDTIARDFQGWHTLIIDATDGTNVNYYINGDLVSRHHTSTGGNAVYPRADQQIAFANWVFVGDGSGIDSSTSWRSSTMEVDWVYHNKDVSMTPDQVQTRIDALRNNQIDYLNTLDSTPGLPDLGQGSNNGSTNCQPWSDKATYEAGDSVVREGQFFIAEHANPGYDPLISTWFWKPTATCNQSKQTPDDSPQLVDYLKLQAEDFSAAADSSAGNAGSAYRNTDVDIETTTDTGGGYNIGWIESGEWLEYSVNLLPGRYALDARVASVEGGGVMSAKINGQDLGLRLEAVSTSGWQSWTTATSKAFETQGGQTTLRIDISAGGFNLNWFEIYPVDDSHRGDSEKNQCPQWSANDQYYQGNIVQFNGQNYIAEHENPGYNPVESTWFWEPTDQTCSQSANTGGSCSGDWYSANLTNYTSYPDPGSEECIAYNGCHWAGQFAGLSGVQPQWWVQQNNIVAVHSKDFDWLNGKTLKLRQGGLTIDAVVYDMCADADCNGCCTRNLGGDGFLIDLEKYTMQRFGSGSGIVEFQVCY